MSIEKLDNHIIQRSIAIAKACEEIHLSEYTKVIYIQYREVY